MSVETITLGCRLNFAESMNRDIVRVLKEPEVIKKFRDQGCQAELEPIF